LFFNFYTKSANLNEGNISHFGCFKWRKIKQSRNKMNLSEVISSEVECDLVIADTIRPVIGDCNTESPQIIVVCDENEPIFGC